MYYVYVECEYSDCEAGIVKVNYLLYLALHYIAL